MCGFMGGGGAPHDDDAPLRSTLYVSLFLSLSQFVAAYLHRFIYS